MNAQQKAAAIIYYYGGGSGGGGASFPQPSANSVPVLKLVATKTIVSGARWYGRTSMKVRNDITILIYAESDAHPDNTDSELAIIFSDDYCQTWTAKNTKLGGGAVSGFPMYPANATPTDLTGPGEPWLMLAPNGDLLLHMWSSDYGNTNLGTYQSRSTDGGETWSAPALITFVNDTGISISDNLNIFSTDDDFVHDGVIYAGAREYLTVSSFGTKIRSWLIKSEDNGTTWELVSLLSAYDDVTNEIGITNVQGTTIRAYIREFVTKAYYTESTNFGLTWSELVEKEAEWGTQSRQRAKSDAQLKLQSNYQNDPVRIINGFTHLNPGNSHPRRRGVWISKDYGETLFGPYFTADAGYDGGYGDMIYNPDLDQYVYTCYLAPWDDTDLNDGIIVQDNFTIEWAEPALLLSDDFSGALDTGKWTLANPDSANLLLSQTSDKLRFFRVTDNAVASSVTNYFESVSSFTHGFASILFRRETGYTNSSIYMTFWNDADNNIIIGQAGDLFVGDNVIYCRVRVGGVNTFAFATAIESSKRLAIEYTEEGLIQFYYWNGARWVAIINTSTGVGFTTGDIGTFKIRLAGNSDADDAASDLFSLHSFRMTDVRHKYRLPEGTAIDYSTLLTDNFNGTVIDTGKWTVTNPGAADLTISQDTTLIFNRTTDNSVPSTLTNNVQSVDSYSGDLVLTAKVSRVGMAVSVCVLSVFKDASNQLQILNQSGRLQVRALISGAGTQTDTGIALTTATRIKVTYLSGVVNFYRYDTTTNQWVIIGPATTGVDLGDGLKIFIGCSSNTSDAISDKFIVDDLRVLSGDFYNILP